MKSRFGARLPAACAGLALAAAMAWGPAAEAQVLPATGTVVLTTDSSGAADPVDYTVPDDGVTYRWDLTADSAHPNALIHLDGPNDIFAFGQVSNGDGTTHFDFAPAPLYLWDAAYAPGHTTILVRAPRSFDNCASPGPAGAFCAVTNTVFGDGAQLSVNLPDVVDITFSSVAIPEPATWLLMSAGVFGLGAALRLRRRSLRTAGPALA